MEAQFRTSYKYRSGAAALRSLSEGTAYFASPRDLNDSLEARFDLAGAASFAETIAITLSELARSRGRLTRFASDKSTFGEFEQANNMDGQRFQEACQRVGVFASASRPDNQPMWAYYCNDSRGVCFELQWPEEVMQQYQLWPTNITYSNESRVHNRADDMREALLAVGQQHPEWSLDQIKEFSLSERFRRRWGTRTIARAVSTKHTDWQHEAELRMVAPRAGPVPIMADILKRVFFIRTDFPEWGAIMMLLHRLYPKVELASMSFDHKEPFVKVQQLEKKLVPVEPRGGPEGPAK